MATVANEVDEVRHHMAQIRRELHQDVREVVASAAAVTNWQRYIQAYPWVSLGVAFAVGYLIVPKRREVIPSDAAQAIVAQARASAAEAKGEAKSKRKGLLGMALGMLAPVLVRVAQGYIVQHLEGWIAQQMQQQQMGAGPSHGPAPGPGGAGRPGGPSRPGGTTGMTGP